MAEFNYKNLCGYRPYDRNSLFNRNMIPSGDIKEPLLLNCDIDSLEILDKLKDIKDRLHSIVVLDMNRFSLDYVEKAYSIIGDKLRVSPRNNQQEKMKHSRVDQYPIYTYQEFKRKEKALDMYAKTVNDYYDSDGDLKSLSPFEKFIAAYIITIKFAPYKMVKNDIRYYHKSRSVYEFADQDNKDIVCVGFVHFLREILERMGLGNTVDIDVKDLPVGNEKVKVGHTRMAIRLYDPKYGIKGIFICDPTFDNKGILNPQFKYMLLTNEQMNKMNIHDKHPGFNLKENKLNKVDLEIGNRYDNKDLFSNEISQDSFIKAHLALERFLDKKRKMLKDNEDYPLFEYVDKGLELGYETNIGHEMGLYQDGIKMNIYDMADKYPNALISFITLFNYHLWETHYGAMVCYDNKKKKYYIKAEVNSPVIENIKEISSMYPTIKENDSIVQLNLYTFDNRTIEAQMVNIKKALINFENEYSKICRKNEHKSVK